MNEFQTDFRYQSGFLPVIKAIVGPLLLEPSSFELDTREATDLLVLLARDMRIACRVRRQGYAEKYPWEFTIRSSRPSGAITEMAKIVDGWGDWMFYGHDCGNGGISRWMVLNLHAMPSHLIRDGFRAKRTIRRFDRSNGDGTKFIAFDALSFSGPPPLLVESSHSP